jgi:hypothetical protein
VIARDLRVGQRAEAYLRFPAGPQTLLNYNELRVWMHGRGEGWETGDLEAFIKVGSDVNNFYLYHARASSTSWDPEMVVDLTVWRRLRAQLESAWLRGDPPSGAAACGSADTQAYVACEGGYVVQMADPGINPPNLAAAQEVAGGIYRVADHGLLPEAELWIDDIRLSAPVSQTGKAMAFDGRLTASDVGELGLSYIRRDGQFRQIGEVPTYRTDNTMALSSNVRLDRFLPPALGFAIPATVVYTRSHVDPELLTGTDLRGADLIGLRRPESWSATYSVQLRRSRRGTSWLAKGFLDPLTFAGAVTRGRTRTELSEAKASNSTYLANYNLQLQRRGPHLPLGGLLGGLPRSIRESEIGRALRNPMISLAPTSVRLSTGLTYDRGGTTTYLVPVEREADSLLTPTVSLSQLWRNSGGVTWQPLGMLTLNGDLTSTRDPAALRRLDAARPVGGTLAPELPRHGCRRRARPHAHDVAAAHAPALDLAGAALPDGRGIRPVAQSHEPPAGPDRRRQRGRVHPAADAQQCAEPRARRVGGPRAAVTPPPGRQQQHRPLLRARAAGGRESADQPHLHV